VNQVFHGVLTALIFVAAPGVSAETDVIHLKNGPSRKGKIIGVDARYLRIRIPSPVSDQPPMEIAEPRTNIAELDFARDEELETLLANPSLPALETNWHSHRPFLGLAKSPAGRIGIAYAECLLTRQGVNRAPEALIVLDEVVRDIWCPTLRTDARALRLRALVAVGKWTEAVAVADAALKESDALPVTTEAELVLGASAARDFERLLQDNPRWDEDPRVRPEHQRLYNEALDHFLHPFLFCGNDASAASRGLAGAIGVYQSAGNLPDALKCARDLVALYPETPAGEGARKLLSESQNEEASPNPAENP